MLRRQAFKFRLREKPAQAALLRRFAGCRRFVWNKALAEQQARRERGEKYVGYIEMAKWLTAWRADPATDFLAEAPVHALQEALKALDEAFKRFFKKAGGYPKFQRRGEHDAFRETDRACFTVDETGARIRLPKIGWVRFRQSRAIEGQPRSVSLSCDARGWHVAIQTEAEAPYLSGGAATLASCASSAISAIGLDRGITNFYATSDGELRAPLNAHRAVLHRLSKYQRAVSRRMEAAKIKAGIPADQPFPKGFRLQKSNRLRRAEGKVRALHAQVARMRQDFLHKESRALADAHALVVVEDLKIRNMSASAAGTAEAPGRRVAQKSSLNRSILDQGWHEFARQLEYKLGWRGGQLLRVNPAYTSQACAACGHTASSNRRGEKFRCMACGHTDHADLNAAKNILAAGHAVLSGDETARHADVEDAVQSGRPMKRQSTQAEALCALLN